MDSVMCLILAGGRGERLKPLTDNLPKPLVRFRSSGAIIDFTLYNCFQSQTGDVELLTQYQGEKIETYINTHWKSAFDSWGRKISCFHNKEQTPNGFRGTADAVFKSLSRMRKLPEFIIVLASDHIYRMNYHDLFKFHKKHGAVATVGCVECSHLQSKRFGIIKSDFVSPIQSYKEKPKSLEGMVENNKKPLASMGIYVFSTKRLLDYLHKNQTASSYDIGHDIIPEMVKDKDAWAFRFVNDDGRCAYWRDVGDMSAYWEASLEQLHGSGINSHLNLMPEMKEIPIFRDHFVQSQICGHRKIINSKIADSANIDDATIENSIVCPDVKIEKGALIKRSVIMDGAVIRRHSHVIDTIVQPNREFCSRLDSMGGTS